MKTQKPLEDLIPDIVREWNDDRPLRQIDWDLYQILNNCLLDHVKASLAQEMISQRAYNQTIQRIPSINIHKRVVDKTSKVYIKAPKRIADSESDMKLMEDIKKSMQLDKRMMKSNKYLNSSFRFALEPYINDSGDHQVRVISAYQFMPFSDSLSSPEKMTVYVKYMFTEDNRDPETGKRQGNGIDVLAVTSDDEFLIIDTGGRIRTDVMAQMDIRSTVNKFGRIPAVYARTMDEVLMPFRNEEGKQMAMLIPKLFADINFASKYLSHSIVWARNVNMDQVDVNADALWDLGESDEAGGATPEVGVISPQVDIPNQLGSIGSQVQNYFESLGMKTQVNMEGSNPMSAVSKAIDEADVTDIRLEQIEMYKGTETEFWDLVSTMQREWVKDNKPKIKKTFSSKFIESFQIIFPETRVMQTVNQKLDEAEKWIDLKMKSRKQIVREFHPEYSDEQIEKMLKEVDDEQMEHMKRKLAGMPGIQSEKDSDGQFKEGNNEAVKVKPENNIRGDVDGGSSS